MTTTTPTRGVTFAQAAAQLAGHLAEHALSEPVSLTVTTSHGDTTVNAQVRGTTVADIAAGLIAWADTLSGITVEAWRPPERDRVHLSIRSTLTGSTSVIELKVFGGVDYDPLQFTDLQPDPCRGMSLSLGQLRIWAANPQTSTDTPEPEAPRGAR